MTKVKNFKTVDEAEEFEQRCLADGWILPKRRGGRPKERDAFDVIAEQVIAWGTRDIAAAVEDRRRKGVKKKAATRSTKRKSTAGE